jgi:hypothetical protein
MLKSTTLIINHGVHKSDENQDTSNNMDEKEPLLASFGEKNVIQLPSETKKDSVQTQKVSDYYATLKFRLGYASVGAVLLLFGLKDVKSAWALTLEQFAHFSKFQVLEVILPVYSAMLLGILWILQAIFPPKTPAILRILPVHQHDAAPDSPTSEINTSVADSPANVLSVNRWDVLDFTFSLLFAVQLNSYLLLYLFANFSWFTCRRGAYLAMGSHIVLESSRTIWRLYSTPMIIHWMATQTEGGIEMTPINTARPLLDEQYLSQFVFLALGCSLVRMAWHCFRSHA